MTQDNITETTAQEVADPCGSNAGLLLMREPFEAHQISKLPKPTKKQTDEVKSDFKKGIRCKICNGWHHPNVVHLDYVGHAALTDRLLKCDINWNWEPMSVTDQGAPIFDGMNGMWIKLTVCGQTRLGYGSPDGKTGGNAVKEVIGDALRNAAMRFGAALDLWHKGDLHQDDDATDQSQQEQSNTGPNINADVAATVSVIDAIKDRDELGSYWKTLNANFRQVAGMSLVIEAKDRCKAKIDDAAKKAKEKVEAEAARIASDEQNDAQGDYTSSGY